MSSHNDHPSTEPKEVSFKTPLILALVTVLVILLFVSIGDKKHKCCDSEKEKCEATCKEKCEKSCDHSDEKSHAHSSTKANEAVVDTSAHKAEKTLEPTH